MTDLIMRLSTRLVTPVATTLAAYLLLRGHVSAGGGFIAAVVIGLALVLRYWTLGPQAVHHVLRFDVEQLIGTGLVVMLATGAAGWLWGDHFLDTASLHLTVPLRGEVSLSSALLFETGVAVTVVAVVVAVTEELGQRRRA
jgi:multisubunit Na+/H+ antiporter MnhB subunit